MPSFDAAVIGAGAFGAWTAHHLRKAGLRVTLLDAYGPGNARASSGGESRVIRMGYGPNEIYTRWSLRSLELWQELSRRSPLPLFHQTGVLWTAPAGHPYTVETQKTLEKLSVPIEVLSSTELGRRFPQIALGPKSRGILEPASGALMARRSVQTLVAEMARDGLSFLADFVAAPKGKGRLDAVRTGRGETISAGVFVFACGPWLPKVFPDLLEGRIRPTLQEVYFFGVPAGDRSFAPPAMPVWIDESDGVYSVPELENRGFKIASDHHGPAFDPDTGERVVGAAGLREMRRFVARRFPALKGAPLVEARVCQYENTSNGDFLIDRHPGFDNVWLVGGGSGHGFKHGPALGEHVAGLVTRREEVEPRFSLATKERVRARAVY